MAVLYSYANLTALLAVNVATLVDDSPRLVKNDSWYQYDASATTGGYPPDVGAGRWFRLSGAGLAEVQSASFTAVPFGDYVVNSPSNITITFPSSPVDGIPIAFFSIGLGRVNAPVGFINNIYRSNAYFVNGRLTKVVYGGSSLGWVCPPLDILNEIDSALLAFWTFGSGSGSLASSVGSYTFTDTGSTSIVYTTGIIGGYALDYDNATNDYQLSQSSDDFDPLNISSSGALTFSFLVNLVSGTEPIISKKWTSSANYTYCVRATDATHIEFEIKTGGTGAGTFTLSAPVTAAYGVTLLIVATMPVAFSGYSPDTMTLQVSDSTDFGVVYSTAITGVYQTSDSLIIGKTETGSQIVGVIDQLRVYNWSIDSNQRSLLWNNGAFI